MRILAALANVALLAFAFFISSRSLYGADFWFAICAIITPILSLAALYLSGETSWLALHFKRRALEERRRIDELSAARK